MGRVKDLPTGNPSKEAFLLYDSESNGTKKVPIADLALAALKTSNHNAAGFHNSIYRGVNLKTHWGLSTDAAVVNKVVENIQNGTFEDLFIGDYFNVSMTTSFGGTENVVCVIAGFDIYLNCGDGDNYLKQHHAIIVPRDCFATTSQMNTSGTSSGGYHGCKLRNDVLPVYATALKSAFNNHIIRHRELLSKTVNTNIVSGGYGGWTGASSEWDWYDSDIELMSECEVYGATINSSSRFDTGIAKTQLPLFRLNPAMIQANRTGAGRQWYWLKDVADSHGFCYVSSNGGAYDDWATGGGGVRPRFLIG